MISICSCVVYIHICLQISSLRKKDLQSSTISVGHIILVSVSQSRWCRMYQLCVGPAIDFVLPRYRSWLGASWIFSNSLEWNRYIGGAQPKLWEHSGVNNLFISNLGRCSCTRFISSVTQVFQKIPWSVNQMRKRRESKQYIHFCEGNPINLHYPTVLRQDPTYTDLYLFFWCFPSQLTVAKWSLSHLLGGGAIICGQFQITRICAKVTPQFRWLSNRNPLKMSQEVVNSRVSKKKYITWDISSRSERDF